MRRSLERRAAACSRYLITGLAVLLLSCGAAGAASTATTTGTRTAAATSAAPRSASAGSPRPIATDRANVTRILDNQSKCMLAQGTLDYGPPPGRGPGGAISFGQNPTIEARLSEPHYIAVWEACANQTGLAQLYREVQPESQADKQRLNDSVIKLTECLRGKGYQMPDPSRDAEGRLTPGQPPGLQGQAATNFVRDFQACAGDTIPFIPGGP